MIRRRLSDCSLRVAKEYAEGRMPIDITEKELQDVQLYLDLLGTGATVTIEPEIQAWQIESIIRDAGNELLFQAKRIEESRKLLCKKQ